MTASARLQPSPWQAGDNFARSVLKYSMAGGVHFAAPPKKYRSSRDELLLQLQVSASVSEVKAGRHGIFGRVVDVLALLVYEVGHRPVPQFLIRSCGQPPKPAKSEHDTLPQAQCKRFLRKIRPTGDMFTGQLDPSLATGRSPVLAPRASESPSSSPTVTAAGSRAPVSPFPPETGATPFPLRSPTAPERHPGRSNPASPDQTARGTNSESGR